MKRILLEEYGGAVATAALVQATKTGKVLNNIPHLDLWTELAIIGTDVFASEHMGEIGQGLLNGAGLAAAALATQTMFHEFVPGMQSASTVSGATTSGSTASTYIVSPSTGTTSTTTTVSTPASTSTTVADLTSSVS